MLLVGIGAIAFGENVVWFNSKFCPLSGAYGRLPEVLEGQ